MLKIRLQRIGKKKAPVYRLIVSEHTKDTQAGSLEILGQYNPVLKEKLIDIKADRINYWISQGAQPSETVHNLLVNAGVIKGSKQKSVTITNKRAKKLGEKAAAAEEAKKAAAEAKKAEEEAAKAAAQAEAEAAKAADESTGDDATPPVETDDSSVSAETDNEDTASENAEATNDNANDDNDQPAATGPTTYAFASGSNVQYVVQKGWVKRPAEDVVGTNNAVSGDTVYNGSTGMLDRVNLTVDSQKFSSGSGGRDGEVRGWLNGPIKIALPTPLKVGSGAINTTGAFDLTINGVTKRVSFSVNGNASPEKIEATGSANITMSDFNVDPPSILGVYSVKDAMTVRFNLNALAQ